MARTSIIIIAFIFFAAACKEKTYSPKPRAYPKVIYPEKEYQPFKESDCGFTFQFPRYALIQQDTSAAEGRTANSCWFDIFFPDFDSRIHCSYYPVGFPKSLDELKSDAFELMDWHKKKANYI